MLNKDQLLKIKGILSAKEGTQVPKFQNPAGPISYTVWKNLPANKYKSELDYKAELGLTPLSQGATDPINSLLQNTATSSTITPNVQTSQDQVKEQQTAQSKTSDEVKKEAAAHNFWEIPKEEEGIPWQQKPKQAEQPEQLEQTNTPPALQVNATPPKSSQQILTDNIAAAVSKELTAPTAQNPLEPKTDPAQKPEVEAPDPAATEKSQEKENINGQTTPEGDEQARNATKAQSNNNLTYTDPKPDTANLTDHTVSEEETKDKKVATAFKGFTDSVSNFFGGDKPSGTTTGNTNTTGNTTGNTNSTGGTSNTTTGNTNGTQKDLQEVKPPTGTTGGTNNTKTGTGVTVTQWGVKKPRTATGEKVKWKDMSKEQKSQYIDGIGQKGGQYAAMAGAAIDTASAMLVNKADYADDSWTNSASRKTYDTVSDTLMQTGGYGAMAGAAMKAVGLINDLGGSKSRDFAKDTATINQVGGSYGGTVSDINTAVSKAGKKYGLFEAGSRHDANKFIAEAERKQNVMASIASTAKDQSEAARNMSYQNTLNYQYQINGGFDQRYLRAAKEGGNIEYFKDPFKVTLSDINDFKVELSDTPTLFKAGGTLLDKLDNNVFKVELSDVPELEKFKEGGSIKDREIEVIETDTTQKSVIPEGALHKNKHHLNDVGVDDSELTKKGIPVVDNQGEQQAEIELNEIIFTLEVTKELESRYKEFYKEGTSSARKDELAIEAGKLLWKEILYNTDDRTGLIDTLKQGGSLKAKESSKPEYSEWVKDVNPEFINDNYDLETAYNYLPYEQLERWKTAVNSPDPDKYLNYQDPKTGEYTYHLGSVVQLNNGDYVFLKKGTEKTNPELHWETDTYYNGTNGLKETHDLVYDGKEGRYFYRRRTTPKKHKEGGVIKNLEQDEITKIVRQALINILITNG